MSRAPSALPVGFSLALRRWIWLGLANNRLDHRHLALATKRIARPTQSSPFTIAGPHLAQLRILSLGIIHLAILAARSISLPITRPIQNA